jgi:hypothetical protein
VNEHELANPKQLVTNTGPRRRLKKASPITERIMELVSCEPNTGCWIWIGSVAKSGYARMGTKHSRPELAHRVSYEAFVGPIPEGYELDHKCRLRCCVNPQHLEPVLHLENVRRGTSGQATAERHRQITHCPKGHAYDEANTRTIPPGRKRYSHRICRACDRARGGKTRRAIASAARRSTETLPTN